MKEERMKQRGWKDEKEKVLSGKKKRGRMEKEGKKE